MFNPQQISGLPGSGSQYDYPIFQKEIVSKRQMQQQAWTNQGSNDPVPAGADAEAPYQLLKRVQVHNQAPVGLMSKGWKHVAGGPEGQRSVKAHRRKPCEFAL